MAQIDLPPIVAGVVAWSGWMGFWYAVYVSNTPPQNGLEMFNQGGSGLFLILGAVVALLYINERFGLVSVGE